MRSFVSSGWSFGVAALVAVALACGDGDPAGPGAPPDVEGVWSYGATGLTGSEEGVQASCSATGGELELEQTGFTFSGLFTVPEVACEVNGEPFGAGPFQGQIVGGTLNGTTVEFQFLGPDWEHQGSISADVMEGSATVRLELDGRLFTLTGSWSATR